MGTLIKPNIKTWNGVAKPKPCASQAPLPQEKPKQLNMSDNDVFDLLLSAQTSSDLDFLK